MSNDIENAHGDYYSDILNWCHNCIYQETTKIANVIYCPKIKKVWGNKNVCSSWEGEKK